MVYFFERMGLLALAMVCVATMLGTAAAQQQVPECAQKLAPCASYLGSPKPPESCCGPIKEAVKDELPCLCSLFSSPQLLKAFNVNLSQALELPKNCGINSDQSLCSNSTSASTSAGKGSSAPPSSTTPASPSTNTIKPAGGAARSLSWIGVSGLICLLWLWWSKIASKMPGRTDNEIKNHWNTHIKKKLLRMGIDPVTHKPLVDLSSPTETVSTSNSTATDEEKFINNHESSDQGSAINKNISQDNSNSSNSSSCIDDHPLAGCVWDDDMPFIDTSWNFPGSIEAWERSSEWLLDYQDFGMGDLELVSKLD